MPDPKCHVNKNTNLFTEWKMERKRALSERKSWSCKVGEVTKRVCAMKKKNQYDWNKWREKK